jgi:hypothetical protein
MICQTVHENLQEIARSQSCDKILDIPYIAQEFARAAIKQGLPAPGPEEAVAEAENEPKRERQKPNFGGVIGAL